MAEKQDAMMNAPSTEVQSAEGAVQPTEAATSVAPEGNTASQSSDNMAWVGGLKRDSHTKGYNKGYQQAQDEMKEALASTNAPAQSPAPAAAQSPAPVDNSQANGQATGSAVSPEMAAAMANQAQMNNHFGQIAQRGAIKYPDYQEKLTDFVKLAQEKEQAGDTDLSMLMTMAANFGDEDIVHKVATDEAYRNEILQTNHKLWTSKLLQSTIQSPASSHLGGSPTIKVAAPPTGNLPKSSSYGDIKQMSSAEKRLKQKQNLRG